MILRGGWLAFVLAFVVLAAPAAAQSAATPSRGHFAGPVELDEGRELYMECRGAGKPIVMLEAGLRSRGDFWSVAQDESTPKPYVQQGIAKFTRVCEYDRPGTTLGATEFSRSTPVPMPRTARDPSADFGRLLRRAGLEGPFVLAGHSTGGLINRLFAANHPKQVAGLVQVDALNEFLEDHFTPAQMEEYDGLNNGPIEGLDYPDLEQILFIPSFAEMIRAAERRPIPGDLPMTVISRKIPLPLPEGLPQGLTTEVAERVWRQAQRDLAHIRPGVRWRIAKRSSHYVMFSQPALIIREVERIVARVRAKRRSD